MPSRKHSLEQPENPRPAKRAETTFASSAGNASTDKSIVPDISKVDIAISKHLKAYRLERDKFDKLEPDQKVHFLSDIFRLIVIHSDGKLDPNLHKIIIEDGYADQWETFVEDHPGLNDILLECWSLDPPSFNKVLELGVFIAELRFRSRVD